MNDSKFELHQWYLPLKRGVCESEMSLQQIVFGNIFDQGENGGRGRKEAIPGEHSCCPVMASDKPTPAIRALCYLLGR